MWISVKPVSSRWCRASSTSCCVGACRRASASGSRRTRRTCISRGRRSSALGTGSGRSETSSVPPRLRRARSASAPSSRRSSDSRSARPSSRSSRSFASTLAQTSASVDVCPERPLACPFDHGVGERFELLDAAPPPRGTHAPFEHRQGRALSTGPSRRVSATRASDPVEWPAGESASADTRGSCSAARAAEPSACPRAGPFRRPFRSRSSRRRSRGCRPRSGTRSRAPRRYSTSRGARGRAPRRHADLEELRRSSGGSGHDTSSTRVSGRCAAGAGAPRRARGTRRRRRVPRPQPRPSRWRRARRRRARRGSRRSRARRDRAVDAHAAGWPRRTRAPSTRSSWTSVARMHQLDRDPAAARRPLRLQRGRRAAGAAASRRRRAPRRRPATSRRGADDRLEPRRARRGTSRALRSADRRERTHRATPVWSATIPPPNSRQRRSAETRGLHPCLAVPVRIRKATRRSPEGTRTRTRPAAVSQHRDEPVEPEPVDDANGLCGRVISRIASRAARVDTRRSSRSPVSRSRQLRTPEADGSRVESPGPRTEAASSVAADPCERRRLAPRALRASAWRSRVRRPRARRPGSRRWASSPVPQQPVQDLVSRRYDRFGQAPPAPVEPDRHDRLITS